jgi:hypothetical protein
MGGEGDIAPSTGIYYPFIIQLAAQFGALVVEPEHRFYGESQPFPQYSTQTLQLLTAQQALADTARFIQYIKAEYKSPNSPVLTIGGSYPGWLSAMMRIRYPEVVDFAYAASAPMRFYSQDVQQYAYYEVITKSAEKASPGCAASVRSMLATLLASDKPTIIKNLELCSPLPDYIQQDPVSTMINEINMVVMYTFATLNMENYPPPNTSLKTACDAIKMSVGSGNNWEALGTFLRGYSTTSLKRSNADCYNLTNQLPAGNNATITSGDWSGVGNGINGANWDFETSTLLVEQIGTNGQTDMFLPREFTLDWLTQHSKIRFNTVPHPTLLADLWGFGDLKKIGTSFIIFTNGLNDGWSAGGVMEPIPEKDIFVLNMPNGAHHSDLAHSIIMNDTPDVFAVKATITQIIGNWLANTQMK